MEINLKPPRKNEKSKPENEGEESNKLCSHRSDEVDKLCSYSSDNTCGVHSVDTKENYIEILRYKEIKRINKLSD